MDDILNTDDLFRDDAFRSREELLEENARLRQELDLQREENELIARAYAQCHAELRALQPAGPQRFVIPDEAIELFEALPESFSLDEVLEAAERAGFEQEEAVRHVRSYLKEEMAVQDAEHGFFSKTGHKPYF